MSYYFILQRNFHFILQRKFRCTALQILSLQNYTTKITAALLLSISNKGAEHRNYGCKSNS
jgi:hypothetical protein